jgi:hypothetical protein
MYFYNDKYIYIYKSTELCYDVDDKIKEEYTDEFSFPEECFKTPRERARICVRINSIAPHVRLNTGFTSTHLNRKMYILN